MNKLLAIVGPTAVGKTGLGIKLAQDFGGEIVSADSRQVYQGMDIITGKDLPGFSNFNLHFLNQKNQQVGYYSVENIPIWLLDVVKPNEKFSAADYRKLAWEVIEDIWQRKKLPIVVGGAGFYLKVLLEGVETMGIPPNWKLRKKLENCSVSELQKKLKEIDPERAQRMNESDWQNPRRLIRAIEVAQKRENNSDLTTQIKSYQSLIIGLTAPLKILYEKINQRVKERLQAGAEEEIKALLEKGYNWENSALGETIGYREWQGFFEGRESRAEAVTKWQFAEHGYARRQITFFRKMKEIRWFDITEAEWEEKVEKLVRNWYI